MAHCQIKMADMKNYISGVWREVDEWKKEIFPWSGNKWLKLQCGITMKSLKEPGRGYYSEFRLKQVVCVCGGEGGG